MNINAGKIIKFRTIKEMSKYVVHEIYTMKLVCGKLYLRYWTLPPSCEEPPEMIKVTVIWINYKKLEMKVRRVRYDFLKED